MSEAPRSYAVATLALSLVLPATVRAQAWAEVGVGARVRLSAPTLRRDRFVGRVDAFTTDSVRLDTADVRRRFGFDTGPVLVDDLRYVTLPRADITRVEVSAGRSTIRSSLLGIAIGGLGGGVISGLGNGSEIENPGGGGFRGGFKSGFVVGAVVGAVIGYAFGGERWAPASWATGRR